jgi:hypothetical protein
MNAATPSRNTSQAVLTALVCCLVAAGMSVAHRQAMAADAASGSDLKWTPHRQSRSEPPAPMEVATRPVASAPAPAQKIDAVAPPPRQSASVPAPAPRGPVGSVVAEPTNPFSPPPQRMVSAGGQVRVPAARQRPASQPAPGINVGEMMSQVLSAAPFTRTPQGEMRTTIYGAEPAASREGIPQQMPSRADRPDRYAMNSDDLPSVMGPSPAADTSREQPTPVYEEVPVPEDDGSMVYVDDGTIIEEMPWAQPHYDPAM